MFYVTSTSIMSLNDSEQFRQASGLSVVPLSLERLPSSVREISATLTMSILEVHTETVPPQAVRVALTSPNSVQLPIMLRLFGSLQLLPQIL